jgi:hypothetical protein
MTQHVDVNREWQLSGLASPFYHARNAHPAEGLAALIDEDVGPLGPASLLVPSQELKAVKFVPLQVMNAVGTVLEPADNDGALQQVASQRRSQASETRSPWR